MAEFMIKVDDPHEAIAMMAKVMECRKSDVVPMALSLLHYVMEQKVRGRKMGFVQPDNQIDSILNRDTGFFAKDKQ